MINKVYHSFPKPIRGMKSFRIESSITKEHIHDHVRKRRTVVETKLAEVLQTIVTDEFEATRQNLDELLVHPSCDIHARKGTIDCEHAVKSSTPCFGHKACSARRLRLDQIGQSGKFPVLFLGDGSVPKRLAQPFEESIRSSP